MLSNYLETWHLSDPQPLVETATSHVYTVTFEGTRVVFKLLTPLGEKDESKGAIALPHFNGQGAVRLLRHDAHAHLLEYASGESLTPLVKNGRDDEATAIIADVLKQLHSVSSDPLPDSLPTLKRWFRSLFQRAERDKRNDLDSIYSRAAPITEALLANPREVRVLHGDIHHENIRYKTDRGWLAFDPKGLIGERTYDTANTLCNPPHMPELVENEGRLLRTAGILAEKLEIDFTRLLAFAFSYACLSASWCADANDPWQSHPLRIAEIIEPHLHR